MTSAPRLSAAMSRTLVKAMLRTMSSIGIWSRPGMNFARMGPASGSSITSASVAIEKSKRPERATVVAARSWSVGAGDGIHSS